MKSGSSTLGLQSKLLHFLARRFLFKARRQRERTVDTRVICATGRRLEDEIAAGRFRADLFYRINVLRITMPRLADRRGDIPQLAEYFRKLHSEQFDKECEPFAPEMISYLQNLPWQGNLRELSNCHCTIHCRRSGGPGTARTGTARPSPQTARGALAKKCCRSRKSRKKQFVRLSETRLSKRCGPITGIAERRRKN